MAIEIRRVREESILVGKDLERFDGVLHESLTLGLAMSQTAEGHPGRRGSWRLREKGQQGRLQKGILGEVAAGGWRLRDRGTVPNLVRI